VAKRRAAVVNLPMLLPSWLLSLRADRKSEQTVKAYSDGVRFYLEWCAVNDTAPLERASLRGWVTALLDGGNQPATAPPASWQCAGSRPGWPRRARSRQTRSSGPRRPSSTPRSSSR